jgi:hypothetical protein
MASEVQRMKEVAWQIIADPRSTRIEKLIALQLIASAKGMLLPALDERFLSVRQVCQLRRIQQELVEKVLKRKARKAKANRKAYLKRRLRELETQPQQTEVHVEENEISG